MSKRKYIIISILFILLSPIPGSAFIRENPEETRLPGYVPEDFPPPITRDHRSVTFTNVSKEVGLAGRNGNYFAWGDYNNDGNSDLLVNGRYLYRNNGGPDYNFSYVSNEANLVTGGPWVSNGVWGDYDNDGWLDIFAGGRSDRLFHNRGDGTFEDLTVAAGLDEDEYPTCAGSWGDYDRDGYLDLYIANGEDWNDGNYIHYPDRLYHNQRNGTFSEVTLEAGMDTSGSPAYGRGATWGDIDNDGWLDLFVSNYRLKPNYLWYNNRDGTFTDIAQDRGCAGHYDTHMFYDDYVDRWYGYQWGHTIGSALGDLDNDGLLDIWTSNLVHKYVGRTSSPEIPYDIRGYVCDDSRIYRNDGAPTYAFTDMRPSSGIPYKPIGDVDPATPLPTFIGDEFWFNAAFGDFDNDGDIDVFVPQGGSSYYDVPYAYSFMFRNEGNWSFTDVSDDIGFRTWCTYGGSWCDYDNDGDLDLVTSGKSPYTGEGQGTYEVRLYRNSGNDKHWLKLKVMDGNMHAVGAQVRVHTASGMQLRQVETGTGCYSSQHDIVLHFGLDNENIIPKVEIIYPDGTVKILENVNCDQTLEIDKAQNLPTIKSLTADKHNVNEGVSVTFDIDTEPICQVSWDFDSDGIPDRNSISTDSPEHVFNLSGTFIIKAYCWSPDGLSGSTDTLKISVTNLAPVANITGELKGFEDQLLHFSASGSFDTEHDLAQMKYYMDFGDGNTSGFVNHSDFHHAYPEMGTYVVSLTILDDDGESASCSVSVNIANWIPVPRIFGESQGYEDVEMTFKGSCNDTLSDRDFIQYAWEFGDGDKSGFPAPNETSHTYTDAGEYIVTLKVKDRHGKINRTTILVNISNIAPNCTSMENRAGIEDSKIFFSGTGYDSESDIGILRYQWDFGDGQITGWQPAADTEHIYRQAGEYIAVLKVMDDDLDTGEYRVNVSIANQIPDGVLTLPSNLIYEDDEVKFTGYGKDTESDEDDLAYRLDFGDGNISIWQDEPVFSHLYSYSGTYRVKLEIRDNSNGSFFVYKSLMITNMIPESVFGFSPSKDLDKVTDIIFDAGGTGDTPSDIGGLNFTWNMGKEKILYGKRVNYTFLGSGKHNVKLTVTDDDGDWDSTSRYLVIENTPPLAVITTVPALVIEGTIVIFDGSASTDTPGDIGGLVYMWKIEGIKKSGVTFEHIFKDAGTYMIYLTVTDEEGDSGDTAMKVIVRDDGVPEGLPSTQSGITWGWIGVIGSITVVLVMVGLILLIIRKKRESLTKNEFISQDETMDTKKTIPYISPVPSKNRIRHGSVTPTRMITKRIIKKKVKRD